MKTTSATIIFVTFSCLYAKMTAFSITNTSEIIEIIDAKINGTDCGTDFKLLVEGLSKFELWALKMFDGSAKLSPGLLYGNTHLVGNYDQCLSISEDTSGINGQYCTAVVKFNEESAKFFSTLYSTSKSKNDVEFAKHFRTLTTTNLFYSTVGFCVPKSCSVDDLNGFLNAFGEMLRLPAKLVFLEEACSFKDKKVKFEKADFYIFLFFASILAIVLGTTVYDIHSRFVEKEPNSILISFSLFTNLNKLTTVRSGGNQLTCLHGIKVLSITKIVLGHSLLLFTFSTNLFTYLELASLLSGTFVTETYPTDTFFVISGILVTLLYIEVSEKKQINFVQFLLHRLIRLISVLVATIMINISVIKYIGDGPFWYLVVAPEKISCERSWFLSLLFINNIINLEHRCIAPSWYLSVDVQLYIVSFFIIYYLKKNPKKTLLVMIGICVCSVIYTIYIVVTKKIGFVIFLQMDQESTHYTYFSPLSRIPSWLVGMFFGYFLHAKISLSKSTNFLLWILSLSTMLALTFYHSVLIRDGCGIWCSIFFNGFSRIIWSSAVGFIIFSCSIGRGGFINKFLSHPIFVVLGRLTYCIFLIHVTVISVVVGSKRQPEHFSPFTFWYNSCGILVLVFLCSLVLHLVFEMPIQSLLRSLENLKIIKTV